MRVFIAIEFEEAIKNELSQAQKKVIESSLNGNFTSENNFHLTVRFIGEVKEDDIPSLIQALEESTYNTKGFQLSLTHLGFFPKGNRSVVWAGTEKSSELIRLFSKLEKNLAKQGFSKERQGLTPHITLGREVMLKERFDDLKRKVVFNQKTIRVENLSLMESKRIGGKMVYKPIFVSPLKQ